MPGRREGWEEGEGGRDGGGRERRREGRREGECWTNRAGQWKVIMLCCLALHVCVSAKHGMLCFSLWFGVVFLWSFPASHVQCPYILGSPMAAIAVCVSMAAIAVCVSMAAIAVCVSMAAIAAYP